MPIIKVYGVPPSINQTNLLHLCKDLQEAAAAVSELEISSDDVTVLFPADRLIQGLGEELICEVVGLFEKPERTENVRQKLAANISVVLEGFAHVHLAGCSLVEVFVYPFSPQQGFSAVRIPEQAGKSESDRDEACSPVGQHFVSVDEEDERVTRITIETADSDQPEENPMTEIRKRAEELEKNLRHYPR